MSEAWPAWATAPIAIMAPDPAWPTIAAEYAELKRRKARELGNDREAYTETKSAFVRRVLSRPT